MSPTNRKVPPLWQRPGWQWLFSMRVGLVLLALLTLASIIGTLITPLERAQALVYNAWWYKYLLLLPTAINMACATVRTIMEKILPARQPHLIKEASFYRSTAPVAEIPFGAGAEVAAAAFRRRGLRVAVDGAWGYGARGMLGRWGAPISHLGFIIVLMGGFATTWLAREGVVSLLEGQQTNVMQLRTEPPVEVPLGFTLRCDDFETGFFPKTQIPSRFTTLVSVQEKGGPWVSQPVEVNRSLSVAGQEIHQTSYNEAKDQARYQLALRGPDRPTTLTLDVSPGQRRPIPGLPGTEIELAEGHPLAWTILKHERPVGKGSLPSATGSGYQLRAVQFEPDFVMDQTIGSRSQTLNNPALKVSLLQGGQPVTSQWLFARADMKQVMQGMHTPTGPFSFDLTRVTNAAAPWKIQVAVRTQDGAKVGDYTLAVGEEIDLGPANKVAAPSEAQSAAAGGGWRVRLIKPVPAYVTFLTLTRNPAIPVIYFGCGLILLGLILAFFVPRREEWFWVDGASGRLWVVVRIRNQPAELNAATQKKLAALGSGPMASATATGSTPK